MLDPETFPDCDPDADMSRCEWGLLTVLSTGELEDLGDMGRLEAGWARASGQPWVCGI